MSGAGVGVHYLRRMGNSRLRPAARAAKRFLQCRRARLRILLGRFGPKAPATAYVVLAQTYRERMNLLAAESAVRQGRLLYPNDLELLLELGMLAIAREEWSEAVRCFQSMLTRFGSDVPPPLYMTLGSVLRGHGSFTNADAALSRGREVHPDNIGIAMEFATVASAAEDWPEAAERWKAVLKQFGTESPTRAYASLARAYRRAGNLRAAQGVVEDGLSRFPNDLRLAMENAELAMSNRDWLEAANRWRTILNRFSEERPPRAYAALARAYRQQENFVAAEEVIKEGLRFHPGHLALAIENAELATSQEAWLDAIARWSVVTDGAGSEMRKRAFMQLSHAYRITGNVAAAENAQRHGGGMHGSDGNVETEQVEQRPALAARRVLPDRLRGKPLVSIIVLTRNGRILIDNMLRSFLAANSYSAFEFIIVDHGSTDGTLELLERWKSLLPIRVVAYRSNNSFSYSNNRAAEIAKGDLLLLLNNDIVFTEDLIGRMATALDDEGIGAVGVKQYPGKANTATRAGPYHIGVRFRWDQNGRFLRPYNVVPSNTDGILSETPSSFPAVTGSALMCRRCEYLSVGGLSEHYVYGYEDVDFCAKVAFALGKDIVSLNDAHLFHDESTSRRGTDRDESEGQRINNIQSLKARFGYILRRKFRERRAADDGSLTGKRFTVGFAVTSKDPSRGAGDLFTALGLGNSLRRHLGCDVRYLDQDEWYDANGLDVYISMRDDTDLSRIVGASADLVTIAWMRNWIDRWAERPWLEDFDLHLCSSSAGARYLKDVSGIESEIVPIAVATDVFNLGPAFPDYQTDCVFTGSSWRAEIPRDIEALDLSALPWDFSVYGKNWENHPNLSLAYRGFIDYGDLPRVYNSAKITVDDSAHHTKPFGSLNSRVFEAIAAGSLVLTNNAIGSEELFNGRLPVWNDAQELAQQIKFYLENPHERTALAAELRDQVLAEHSFDSRADRLTHLIAENGRRLRVAIKCPAPRRSEAPFWGDFHLAKSLARALRKRGYCVRIDLLDEWYERRALGDDVVIVLRGLSEYDPSPDQINLCWLISHPTKVTDGELENYDHVFVASETYAERLAARISKPVTTLLQCSDPYVFHPVSNSNIGDAADLLFVGNSRRQRRKIVDDALEAELPIEIYGREWDGIIDSSLVRGELIENHDLHAYYGKAKIVLNDHWPDMAANGFVSNRLFDVALSGGFAISDNFAGKELFGDAVVTYGEPHELREQCAKWLADDEGRKAKAEAFREIVLNAHTFDHRAAELHRVISDLDAQRMRPPSDEPLESSESRTGRFAG